MSKEFENFENQLHILVSCLSLLPEDEVDKAITLAKQALLDMRAFLPTNNCNKFDNFENSFTNESASTHPSNMLDNGIKEYYGVPRFLISNLTAKSTQSGSYSSDVLKVLEYDSSDQPKENKTSSIEIFQNGFSSSQERESSLPLNFKSIKNMQYLYCPEFDSQSEVILNLCSKIKDEQPSSSSCVKEQNWCSKPITTGSFVDETDYLKSGPIIKTSYVTSLSNSFMKNDEEFNELMITCEPNNQNIFSAGQLHHVNASQSEQLCNMVPQNYLVQTKDCDTSINSTEGVALNLKKADSDTSSFTLCNSHNPILEETPLNSICDEALNLVRKETISTENVCSAKIDSAVPVSLSEMTVTDESIISNFYVSCRKCKQEIFNESAWSEHQSECFKSILDDDQVWTESRCPHCDTKITSKILQKKHLECHRRNTCSKCQSTFGRSKQLQAHMKSVHNVKVIDRKILDCEHCNRTFHKKSSLYYHLQSHCLANEKVCQLCGIFCSGEANFKTHMKQHLENSSFKCDICHALFLRSQQYDAHMKGHSKYVCKYCDASLASKKSLFYHYKDKHSDLPRLITLHKNYPCDMCSKVFIRPSLLRNHKLTHSGMSPYACKECNVQFSQEKILLKHLQTASHELTVNSSDQIKKFVCDFCDFSFASLLRLRKHCYESHQKRPSMRCQKCDFKTHEKRQMINHKTTHELQKLQKKFMCEMCGISFRCLATLKEHFIFLHSNERHFKCSKCDKSFKKKSCLVRHNRCHSNERPYKCECGVSYKQHFHLVRHKSSAHKPNKVKTNDKPNLPPPQPIQLDKMMDKDFLLLQPNSGTENTTPLFTVLDSQLIHLIPSALNVHHHHDQATVSLVGNDHLHGLSLSQHEGTFPPTEAALVMQSTETEVLPSSSSVDLSKSCLQLPSSIVEEGSSLQFSNSLEILPFDTSHNYLN